MAGMKLVSIQVGKPKLVGTAGAADPMDREWVTGLFKEGVDGGVVARTLGLDGDGQADLKVHGGVDMAINAYPLDHYAYWNAELGLELVRGAFGENFTTWGATEEEVSVGDVYRIGDAVVQISQPRQPCWKIARRWKVKDLAVRVEKTGKTGWYFRVLEEGTVMASAEFELIERPFPQWTIAKVYAVMRERKKGVAAAAELARCEALSATWREMLAGEG
jgi:MOSC domain-containing protein YiiM